jgi:UDP-N-acetylglucosamine 2-epimerase (non-hydrolysing)
MKITLVAGARPNFIKVAPIIHAIEIASEKGKSIKYRLVHTGQHYDKAMSQSFFDELNIPEPHNNLGCGGGTQAEQTAAIMIAFEKEMLKQPTDLVVVVGDVTSTMACSIVAKKLNTKVAHVEAGIRSGDLTMPEEINRMVTDCLADYYFTTSHWAGDNLKKNGAKDEQIYFVGNVMIDTLLKNQPRFQKPDIWDEAGLQKGQYIVMTLHRPANVDEEAKFKQMLETIIEASRGLPIIFPVHPRTRKIIKKLTSSRQLAIPKVFGTPARHPDNYRDANSPIRQFATSLNLIDPLGYLHFNYLVQNAKAVITDSGGITEETTVMGVPCITLRDNTERPETVEIGTNELIGTNPGSIAPAFEKLFKQKWKTGKIPLFWDGNTSERIVKHLLEIHEKL